MEYGVDSCSGVYLPTEGTCEEIAKQNEILEFIERGAYEYNPHFATTPLGCYYTDGSNDLRFNNGYKSGNIWTDEAIGPDHGPNDNLQQICLLTNSARFSNSTQDTLGLTGRFPPQKKSAFLGGMFF